MKLNFRGKLYQTLLFILFDTTVKGVITLKKKKRKKGNSLSSYA